MINRKTLTSIIVGALILPVLSGCQVTLPENIPSSEVTEEKTEDVNTREAETDDIQESEVAASDDMPDDNGADDEKVPEEIDIFKELSCWDFEFCSGAGAWSTNMAVNPDGSFEGDYHDSDMGDIGPGYDGGIVYCCKFKGKFDSFAEKAPYKYVLNVSELNFEKKPDTEEILDGVLYKYTDPYGLEGITDGTSELVLYAAGAKTDEFNDEILSWIQQFGTYIGSDWQYAQDIPEELPFPVLVNTAHEYAFYSYNISGTNKTYLKNRAKLPGLHNSICDIHDDGTYEIEDINESGSFKVRNFCFPTDKSYDTYNENDVFVKDVVEKVYGSVKIEDLYTWSPKDMSSMEYDKAMVNGTHTDYAIWDYDSGDKKKSCQGRFMYDSGYEGKNGFAYAFIIETDDGVYDDPYINIADMYLGSLTLTGRNDALSCAGEGEAAVRSMLADIKAFTGDSIPAREMIMVSPDDTELIKKYNLDPDDFYDDYQLVTADDQFKDYKIADPGNCPIYIQFPDDQFHKLVSEKALNEYITKYSKDDTRLMNIYLDDKDRILFAFEQYVP